MNRAPNLAELRLAFERYLLARVQLVELKTWGGSTSQTLHQTVNEFREMEKAYVEDMLARRKAHAEDKRQPRRK
jgi:hypothetical protein